MATSHPSQPSSHWSPPLTFWASRGRKERSAPPWTYHPFTALPEPERDRMKPGCEASLAAFTKHPLSPEWPTTRLVKKWTWFGCFLLFSPLHIHAAGSGSAASLATLQIAPEANDGQSSKTESTWSFLLFLCSYSCVSGSLPSVPVHESVFFFFLLLLAL